MLSHCESGKLRGPCLHICGLHDSPTEDPWALCLSVGRYILVTPRVLRVGNPENIHVQAHSDSRQPLTGTLEVNLTVWDFPLKKKEVARSQLTLSPENHFMSQAALMVSDGPAWVATNRGSRPAARAESGRL